MKVLIDPRTVDGKIEEWEHIVFEYYVKKPIPILARQMSEPFTIETSKGTMTGKAGDYLIRDGYGEYNVCDQDIFKEIYTKAEGQ